MATDYSTAFVNQYKANLEVLMQQKVSKLSDAVRVEMQNGEYAYYDQISAITTSGITAVSTANVDTVISEPALVRRRVGLEYFPYATLVDEPDRVKMLVNPDNALAQNIANVLQRKKDSLIITAANGTAYTGKAGGTSTSFDSNMAIPASGTGTNSAWAGSTATMNVDKLRGASYLLDSNDIDPDQRYFIAHPKAKADLLNTTAVTSADYNTVRALVSGDIDTFMGFKFIFTTLCSSTVSFAWHKNAMLLAVGKDLSVRIEERADKNYSTQIFNSMMVGATRMDESGVVQITTA
jgi:hypothetical protein